MHQTAKEFPARFIPWIETCTQLQSLSIFLNFLGASKLYTLVSSGRNVGSLKPQTALPTLHCCSLCSFRHFHQEMKEFCYSAAAEYSAFPWPCVTTWLYSKGLGTKPSTEAESKMGRGQCCLDKLQEATHNLAWAINLYASNYKYTLFNTTTANIVQNQALPTVFP